MPVDETDMCAISFGQKPIKVRDARGHASRFLVSKNGAPVEMVVEVAADGEFHHEEESVVGLERVGQLLKRNGHKWENDTTLLRYSREILLLVRSVAGG